MGRKKGSKNYDRDSGSRKPKTYAPSYWHADRDDSGKPIPGQAGKVHYGRGGHKAYVNVDEDSVPDDTPIFVQGMVEDLDERDRVDQHWKGFHDVIDAGGWVRLVYGGPLDPEQFANKAEAEAKYGRRDREGFEKVAGKDRRTKVVNLTEFLTHPEYFLGWSEPELGWVRSGSIVGILFVLWRRMHEAGVEFTELYGIVHDKDVRKAWSQDDRKEHTVPKDRHVHVLGRISKALTPERIAETLGVNVECLTLPTNRYSYNNFLAYLVHIKYAWKAQYEPEEVVTLVGTPYMAVYSVNHHDWMIGRSKMRDKRASSDHDLPFYLDLVRKGELTIHEMLLDDELFLVYCRHEKQFKDAEKQSAARGDARRLEDFRNKKFSKSFFYVQGRTRGGKSLFADAVGYAAQHAFGWPYVPDRNSLPPGHSLEKAHGLDTISLNDAKASSFGGAKGFLGATDPHRATSTDERYESGDPLVYRSLSMTDTRPIVKALGPMFYDEGEDVSQVLGRVSRAFAMLDRDLFGTYGWSVLRSERCRPRAVGFPRMNARTGDMETVAQEGVTFRLDPTHTPDGEPIVHTVVGALEEAVLTLNANNGYPLAGLDQAYLHEVCQEAAERAYGDTPIDVPDSGLAPWVRLSEHPAVLEATEHAAKVTAELEAGGNARYDAMCRAAASARLVVDPCMRAHDASGRRNPFGRTDDPLELARPYPREGCRPYLDAHLEGTPYRSADEIARDSLADYMRRFEEATGRTLASVVGEGSDDAALDWLCHDRALRTGYHPDAGERKLAELKASISRHFERTEEIEIVDAGRKRIVLADTTGW